MNKPYFVLFFFEEKVQIFKIWFRLIICDNYYVLCIKLVIKGV